MNKKIRMLIAMAGPDESYAPGDVIERPVEVAAAWVEAGMAEMVNEPETATAPPQKKGK